MNRIKFLLIPALCAALAFSSCKRCKECAEYETEDDQGNPLYSAYTVEKCGDALEDAEDAMTNPIFGTSHHAWDCN